MIFFAERSFEIEDRRFCGYQIIEKGVSIIIIRVLLSEKMLLCFYID